MSQCDLLTAPVVFLWEQGWCRLSVISIGRYPLQEQCVRWVRERPPSPLPSIQDVLVQECFVCDDEHKDRLQSLNQPQNRVRNAICQDGIVFFFFRSVLSSQKSADQPKFYMPST